MECPGLWSQLISQMSLEHSSKEVEFSSLLQELFASKALSSEVSKTCKECILIL